MPKDEEIFGLFKVPDEEVIKSMRIEIGKLNSYITELEFKCDMYEIKKHEDLCMINNLKNTIDDLRKRIKELKR